ncbi:uncharacterized protein Z520_10242 [Fonsecaea multimorphosa CBS 102226]|uniref:Uncharacterized protein n=1 Tax=Fonsecaea multimorphosa CBS 102226 TaxID=1442371 RepID=A0A0D2GWE7_9EURO|nr:uncharacterized protein Z520_10242 [Fonsecaea multimorphosa CBS 102226]KIX93905.1 hypothetical protein Z520_10242 [Fonsecaea multimorphosa CBS 102226]OAL19259.1 hypothetical protein AYO22_09803 [Fonsecaea multimorphosa]
MVPNCIPESMRLEADDTVVPVKQVQFQRDDIFSADNASDMAAEPWSSITAGEGYVLVENPRRLGLTGGMAYRPTSAAEVYGVSMFHQLHCLMSIKHSLLQPRSSNASLEAHIVHCVDYLRQSVMCCGDTTLERGHEAGGIFKPPVDGWGNTHMCRDWDALFSFAMAHQYEVAKNSGILSGH